MPRANPAPAAAAPPLPYLKTMQVCEALGVNYPRLMSAILAGKIPPPAKDVSGDLLWTAEDIERARLALATDRRLKRNRTPNGRGAA